MESRCAGDDEAQACDTRNQRSPSVDIGVRLEAGAEEPKDGDITERQGAQAYDDGECRRTSVARHPERKAEQ
jgi:hypothetical protein